MKVILLNGSPRMNGNTRSILKNIEHGINENLGGSEVKLIDLSKKDIKPCAACNGCIESGGRCVLNDDTAEVIKEIFEADAIVFGSPVYWWGMTAQMKAIIDKFNSCQGLTASIKSKKVGIITIGEAPVDAYQYKLISDQYKCIFNYLNWEICFDESISANEPGDVDKNSSLMEKSRGLWESLLNK
ncbi:flavodoxin family protein [Wukongibacter sp. M2B1]|uniref:flavodoxin family protein n=1 Tax=Wukongibacter sp. M2B1 TaxID=3088895 RepID=UPI003D7A6378